MPCRRGLAAAGRGPSRAGPRAAWGEGWADRILHSAVATQLLASGLADADELAAISAAWRDWSAQDDGWFSLLHGELLIHV